MIAHSLACSLVLPLTAGLAARHLPQLQPLPAAQAQAGRRGFTATEGLAQCRVPSVMRFFLSARRRASEASGRFSSLSSHHACADCCLTADMAASGTSEIGACATGVMPNIWRVKKRAAVLCMGHADCLLSRSASSRGMTPGVRGSAKFIKRGACSMCGHSKSPSWRGKVKPTEMDSKITGKMDALSFCPRVVA